MTGTRTQAEQSAASWRAPLTQFAEPLRQFLSTEAGSAGLLLSATLLALLWANSPWADDYFSLWATDMSIEVGSHSLQMDLGHWVNDGLMVLFFFVIGLEVRREIEIGELSDRRRLLIPTLAALGGLVVPTVLYLAVNSSGDATRGWGVVIGTDTAFLLGALALVGPTLSAQLRVFLLTITVIDDVMAVSIIGVVFSESLSIEAIAIAGGCLAALALLSRLGVWSTTVYLLVGVVLWIATVESGLHPTIAGMAAGLLIGARPPGRDLVERASSLFRAFRQSPLPSVGRSAKLGLERAVSLNERLQSSLHLWTSYVIVPLFALANAGVDLRDGVLTEALKSPITWGVVLGLVVGKTVGIGAVSLVAVRMGIGSIPRGVGPGQILAGGALSGLGFTVSLLIVILAFADQPEIREQATVGVLLAGIFSFLAGWAIFRLAAILLGEHTATLPLYLDRPVNPARDHIQGPEDARWTLVEYGDFECPYCSAARGSVREVLDTLGDDVRYVFRHLPLAEIHPHASMAAEAAEAAGAQDRFWEMHDLLFVNQEQLQYEDLLGYAAQIGLDVETFARDLLSGRYSERVREDVHDAEASGARATPTFFVGNKRHVGPFDAQTLLHALQDEKTG